MTRESPRCRQQSGRRGQRQGTGAGDDQNGGRHPGGAARVNRLPHKPGDGRKCQHDAQKGPGPAIGQLRQSWLARRGAVHQIGDLLQARVTRAAGQSHRERCVQAHTAGRQGIARLTQQRAAFATEQRFVDLRNARLDNTICRHGLPGSHADTVARSQLPQADQRYPALVVESFDALGQPCKKVAHAGHGALARRRFEPAADQQKSDEHGQRIKPDLTAGCAGSQASYEGNRDAESHWYIHADPPGAQIAPGAGKERAGGKQHDRQRQDPLRPGHESDDVLAHCTRLGNIAGDRIHHHLHHAQHGHQHSPQRRATSCCLRSVEQPLRNRPGPIAQARDPIAGT